MAYNWKPLAAKFSDDIDSTGMSDSQKTALIGAWSIFSENLYDHSTNIFSRFYDENIEYLRHWYILGNDVMHQHSENVLHFFNGLIVSGLRDSEVFDESLHNFGKFHKSISKSDIEKLNKAIKDYFLDQVKKHKTKTLEEAINILMEKIESKFQSSDEICSEENWRKFQYWLKIEIKF